MSYFPPPPPAPPPAEAYPPPNYAGGSTGFRGRGNRGHRGRGGNAYSRGAPQARGRGGYSRGMNGNSVHFDNRNGNGHNSFDQYGQTQQPSENYMPPPPCPQVQVSDYSQQAGWNAHAVIAPEPRPLQVPPILGYNPQPGGTHPGFYQPSPGFQPHSHTGGFLGGYDYNGMNGQPPAFTSPQAAFPTSRGRGQKRGYNEAFGHRGRGRGRGSSSHQAAPAVPNFGGPLPLPPKPPAPESEGKRAKKDKRKNNTLGLTPKVKVEDEEFADESEDDENEESKLAANGVDESNDSQILQINYRGQTSVLQSAADLAAWIEERKKRYPTKAKAAEAAEKKRQQQEARKAARDAALESHRKAIAEQKEKQAQNIKHDKKHKKIKKEKGIKEESVGSQDTAAKAKRRIEDLRRKLEKEERRIAKAEAKISKNATKSTDDPQEQVAEQATESKKRKRSSSTASADHLPRPRPDPAKAAPPDQPLPDQDVNSSPTIAPDPLTPLSNPLSPTNAPATPLPEENDRPPRASASPTSSSTLDPTSDDETSPSGSSSSDSDSDSSSGAPSETAMRPIQPQRFPPPPRNQNGTQSVRRCKFFVRNRGTCRVGDQCMFRHELPPHPPPPPSRGGKKKAGIGRGKGEGGREAVQRMQGRVGLWQRLVEQEKRVERAAERVKEAREAERKAEEGEGEGGRS